MERYKSGATRLMPGSIRGRFCRASGTGRRGGGKGDLRVSKCSANKAGRTRVDIRIRANVCEQYGFTKGMPVLMDYEMFADRIVFSVQACRESEGVSLCENSKVGNNDLRTSFTVNDDEVSDVFDGRQFFAADVTEDFGINGSGLVKFVCDFNN